MNNLFDLKRHDFYLKITKEIKNSQTQFVFLTHIIPDFLELLSAVDSIAKKICIIAIPYSLDNMSLAKISLNHKVILPTLDDILNPNILFELVKENVDFSCPTIFIEVGGYCSSIIKKLYDSFEGHLLGIIEDTEAGHRNYEKIAASLPIPVISVARSTLKVSEDFLVGTSCAHATEKLLRSLGCPLHGQICLVLGYGKIGRGVAYALRSRHASVMVYDTNPIKRIIALSEGFQTPDKDFALGKAELIFGSTGNTSITQNDYHRIKDQAILISCSSKKIEFELDYLALNFNEEIINPQIKKYSSNTKSFFIASEGQPINLANEKELVGPIISLVHGEILLAIKYLLSDNEIPIGFSQIPENDRITLATHWIDIFCHDETGRYKYV